jgi:chloramphenicol 3-O phosphotransferase
MFLCPEIEKMSPWIILLSGPTSSGKTELARALQRRLSTSQRPFLHIEADKIGMPHIPEQWNQEKEKHRFGRAFRQSAMAYVEEGYDIIIDGILPFGDPVGVKDALDRYGAYRLCYVGVHCDLETLERRVSTRPDRDIGFARQQFQNLHKGQEYDIEIDTTSRTPEEAAELVATFLQAKDSSLKDKELSV